MARALYFLSFLAALTKLSRATQSALELLSEEENEFHQRRLDFDNWCNRELQNQEKQRKELSELQAEDLAEEREQFEVSETLLEVARQLQPNSALPFRPQTANVTLTALQAVERDLAARAPRFFFGGTRGLQAVQKLLQEARDKVHGFSVAQTERASLEARLEVLKAEEKKSGEVLAAQRAKGLAAQSGRKVLETALAQTEASLSEAAGLCGLGRTVLNRSEAAGQMLSRKALELIGMVEGSPAAGSVASAASLPVLKPSSAAPVASDLLAVSQQLQLQQQQVQQQLEELRQMKQAATPSLQKTPAEQSERSQVEEQDLDHVDPPSDPPTRPLVRKKSKASMSLAAETAEASKSEANVAKIDTVKIQEAATQAPKAVPAAKAHAKSKEIDEDSNHLQAPKDFPAALRGGWQALLAKKRAEGFKKSSAKVEEHSSIMDLMQTPKTYTAWQPDKGPSQPAEKAKEDLLAAEKAFDDDDESGKNMFSKKRSKQSFLQLDDADLGGADPLSFFQMGSMSVQDLSIPPFAAARSEVAMLLEKFADLTNSSTLLELSKSQLQTKDFEMLLEKLTAESDDDRSQQFCASVLQKETSIETKLKAELKEYYQQAKARHEAQALRREVVAREHLVSVFGNTSQRFTAVQELLQQSFSEEHGRLQRLEAQLLQLEATKNARSAAEELHSILGQLQTTMHHAQEELEDTLASASSRQKQAEKMDQQSLEQLVAHVKGLERSLAVVDSSPKLEKLCRLEAESRAQRQEKHQMELEALRTAKALNELL